MDFHMKNENPWCASFNVALLLVLGTVIWFTHQIEYPSTRLRM